MGRGLGRWGLTFERGAGPLLRACLEGRGRLWEAGLLECGLPEFGGGALVGVCGWGLGPAH